MTRPARMESVSMTTIRISDWTPATTEGRVFELLPFRWQ